LSVLAKAASTARAHAGDRVAAKFCRTHRLPSPLAPLPPPAPSLSTRLKDVAAPLFVVRPSLHRLHLCPSSADAVAVGERRVHRTLP
jgi:hypothetical protein